MRRLVLALALLMAPAAMAQEEVSRGTGAVLRGLDKISGTLTDMTVPLGQHWGFGRLDVAVTDCRYPAGNPAGDAYAHLTILQAGTEAPLFEGWMVASSPALNALDHPRYDIWLLRCSTS